MTRSRSLLLLVAALLGSVLGPVARAGAGLGSGTPVLSTSASTLPAGQPTIVTVTGLDYLVPPHQEGTSVFGGVYVFFGFVSDPVAFGPSTRSAGNGSGEFGQTYAYPGAAGSGDTRADDPNDATAFVAFTQGGESGAAASAFMDRNGNWTATVRVPGSTFSATLPSGEARHYDCQTVRCGIFTIGAHGKVSSTNERFTPVTFTGPAPAPTTPPTAAPATTPTTKAAGAATTAPTTVAPAVVTEEPTTTSSTAEDRDLRTTTEDQDGGEVVLGVRSSRDGGGSGGLILAGGAGALAAVAAALAIRRRRTTTD